MHKRTALNTLHYFTWISIRNMLTLTLVKLFLITKTFVSYHFGYLLKQYNYFC